MLSRAAVPLMEATGRNTHVSPGGGVPPWDDWKLFLAPGCLLGPLPIVLIRPESLGHFLFLAALGTALMCAFAHGNGAFLPRRPLLAWGVILFIVPAPFVKGISPVTRFGLAPLHDSPFQVVVSGLSALLAAGLLAWVHARLGSHRRLAGFLRAIAPPHRTPLP